MTFPDNVEISVILQIILTESWRFLTLNQYMVNNPSTSFFLSF